MRICIDDRYETAARDAIRRIVRQGFDEIDGPEVEVHVKALAPRVRWLVRCDDVMCAVNLDQGKYPQRWRGLAGKTRIERGHVASTRAGALMCHGDEGDVVRCVDDRATDFSGRAYRRLPTRARVNPRTRWLVTLKTPLDLSDSPYPYRWIYHRAKTAGSVELRSWREHLLHLAAHEARHLVQYRDGLPASEVDAECWARATLRRHRKRR